jgi:hypothetical protein
MEAAQGLAERDDTRWVAPIAAELTRRLRARSAAAAAANGQAQGQAPTPESDLVSPYVLESMLVLLVTRGGEVGMDTLRRTYPELSTEERMYILSSLGEIEVPDPQSLRNIVELLAGALDDASIPGEPIYGGGDCLSVGDLAAFVLAAKLQREFRCTASPRERQRGRIALANAVRAESGEPPIAVAEEPPPPAPDAADADAARVALSAASDAESARAALSRYEAMGLGGLAPLLDDAAELPEGHAARAAADEMARRLASTLTDVAIDDSAVPLPNRAAYEARQGRPLGSRDLLELLVATVASMQNGRLSLRLDRDGAGHGARLVIETRPAVDGRRLGSGFNVSGFVREGDASHRVHTYDTVMRALGRGAWRDAFAHLEPVLDGAPSTDGEAALLVTWSR